MRTHSLKVRLTPWKTGFAAKHGRSLALIGMACLLISATALSQVVSKKDGKASQVRVFGSNLVSLPSASTLYQVQIMVRAGSEDDPAGKEGTANLAARSLIEGGFGPAKNVVTKEKLAEITRPWGDAALPHVLVEKETTTFSMVVPK